MIDYEIKEYVRLIGSISLPKSDRIRIAEQLIKDRMIKKEIPKKYFAAASVAVVLTVGAVMAVRGMKQDIGIL
ncbi:MAG: hypothetical protein E7547_08735 [Ruminococcaceae bacterium]|nr:hypothetical protein [Oscillospiraceae bacterium]